MQTFSLRNADVEHQKSRIIYQTPSPSEHEIVHLNVSGENLNQMQIPLLKKRVKISGFFTVP